MIPPRFRRAVSVPPRGPDALALRGGVPRRRPRLDRRQPPRPRAGRRRGVLPLPAGLAAQAQRARLGRADLALGVRRRRRHDDRAGDLLRGDRARPRAADGQRARAHDGRADGDRARYRRPEGALPRSDPQRRRDLVPGVQRAGVGVGPGVIEDPRRAEWRRLRGHRAEGVDDLRAPVQVVHAARPHQPGGAQASRAHVLPDGHGAGRRQGPPARADHRRGGVQRAVHRGGAHPGRQRRRRRRQRLAGRDHPTSTSSAASATAGRSRSRR